MIRNRRDWNKSGCNPFNDKSDFQIERDECVHESWAVVPERPRIVRVKNPKTNPFAVVEFLRTPIDNLHFELYKFNEVWDDIIGGGPDYTFTVYKYVAWLPSDVFHDNKFYVLRCRASNDVGFSEWSNNYELNFLVHNEEECPGTTITLLDCDGFVCCNDILVCA